MAQHQTAREFWVSDGVEDAVRKTKLTLKKLGDLTAVVPNQHVVGTVAFGVRPVTLKIAWRPEAVETKLDQATTSGAVRATPKTLGTMLVIEASSDIGETACRSALERFEEAYLHFDRTDYQPDRLGLLPATIIGIILALVLLGVLLAKKTNLFKPEVKKPTTADAPADATTATQSQ